MANCAPIFAKVAVTQESCGHPLCRIFLNGPKNVENTNKRILFKPSNKARLSRTDFHANRN
jgi:hypothetical protein